jgi:high-affinity Fe2+/Pb2+ permease
MAPVIEHRNIALLMAGIVLAAVVLRLGRRKNFAGRVPLLYVALLIVASGLAALTGHLGGKMVFGDTYLPF